MDRKYLIAGLFFTAAAIIAVVLTYPKYQVMRISSQLVTDKENEFIAQNVLVQEISRLKSQQKQMTDEIAAVTDLLPLLNEKSTPDLFVEVEGIAAESGLSITTVSFGGQKSQTQNAGVKTSAPVTQYKIITAQLKMQGEYDSFKKFVRTIETNKHLMDISFASIIALPPSRGAKKGADVIPAELSSQQTPTYSVTLQAYYQ